MINTKTLRSSIIIFTKKIKIYYFLKFLENIFAALNYYFAKFLSIVFYKQVINLIPQSLNDKFTSTLAKPENYIQKIMLFALVRKLQKANYDNDHIFNFWESRNSLKWFNNLNENKFQYSYEYFENQAKFILTRLNNLIKKQKINDLLLIDISVGNGIFLNFFAERINGNVLPVGFDINRLVIEQNQMNNKLNHIHFKHGLLSEHEKYIENLMKKRTTFFLARKSLTSYKNEELNQLLTFISRISGLKYFIVIEANNFYYKIKKETKYRDHPLFYKHNYPLIFKKHNWLLIDSKIEYLNFFINDHIANFIFKKTT
jgi:hypothetical protein